MGIYTITWWGLHDGENMADKTREIIQLFIAENQDKFSDTSDELNEQRINALCEFCDDFTKLIDFNNADSIVVEDSSVTVIDEKKHIIMMNGR